MMFRRWHHGHSTAVGVLVGLLLARHAVLLVGAGVMVGFVARDLYVASRFVARWFAHRRLRSSRNTRSVSTPATGVRLGRRPPADDGIPF